MDKLIPRFLRVETILPTTGKFPEIDEISLEMAELSRQYKVDVRCLYEGVELVARYQPHALSGAYLLAKHRDETSASA